ncbi:MAG: GNAT family N-acetyltransferase [Chloroflexi bacterium]|nr:GNAT family N-acetyltransferase [Chloroflexota bacterium]
MPVVKYTNNHRSALVEFVASHSGPVGEPHDLCSGIFQGVLGQPGLEPTENCLVLEQSGQIKGLAIVFKELPIQRSVIEVMTSPELSGSSEDIDLMHRALALATVEGINVAHVCVPPDSDRGQMLEKLGFAPVRTYLDMLWDQGDLPGLDVPQGYSVRSFQKGDTSLLTQVQNDSFTGSWGFCPNTEEQIEYRTNMPNTSKAGILFLFEGDTPAGYCWTVLVPVNGGVRGMIGMIGVVPAFRGKGVSRHILQAGMKHLRSVGQTEIGLEVDGNNDPAVRLYTSIGFKTLGKRHWFERVLPGT